MRDVVDYENLNEGDVLRENIYRHDSLLALPSGTVLKKRELEYLKDLQITRVRIRDKKRDDEYTIERMIEIIEDVFLANTIWEDERSGSRLFNGVKKRINENQKIANHLRVLWKDDYMTFAASINISVIVSHLMMLRNSVDSHLVSIAYYSLIHDIGRGDPEIIEITSREQKLGKGDFEKIQEHPVGSVKMMREAGLPENEIGFAMQTHEKYDGLGYPVGHYGEDIEPLAQLIAVAEFYDALSSFRPQRPAFHPIEVRAMIEKERGKNFGSQYVDVFKKKFTPYREGTYVEMMDGRRGRVVKINEYLPLFPIVEIYKSRDSNEVDVTIDLYRQQNMRIARVLV